MVGSLIASTLPDSGNSTGEEAKRTYKVIPGKPKGMSYAKDIANKFGISLEQLITTINERKHHDNRL